MSGANEHTPASTPSRLRAAHLAMGLRTPRGRMAGLLAFTGLAWSAFQLWVASPLPEWLGVGVLNEARIRSLHLAFAVFLALLAYPVVRRHAGETVPRADIVLATLAAVSAGYLALFYESVGEHTGDPWLIEVVTAAVGLSLLLEATRRVLGLPMVGLALALLTYIFFGELMPDLIAHKGASFSHTMGHLWLGTEGVFGVALGVSAGFIFLFVLFGALLETAGAGSYFIRSAVALLGHLRGGPAKAAVVASAATGLISGSSITNVVTTGPLTIPLIKRVGYPAEKAAAIEVAASVNGQVMPPVMGAAAFLMVEYVGVPYVQVLKHALISALVSYLGLMYIVHLEAVKANMRGLPRRHSPRWQRTLANISLGVIGLAGTLAFVTVAGAAVHAVLPQISFAVVAVLMLAAYVVLLRISAPHIRSDDSADAPITALPAFGPTLRSGLHFLLPVGALVWNLVIEQLSPTRAAFWAVLFLAFIVLTQRPILAWFRGDADLRAAALRGAQDLIDGLATGARNMVTVAIATATAGIIVGTVTLTGIGLVMTDLVTALSGGNIILMLVLVALICLVLGMGLPTTANYIVVSSLLAPVVVALGQQNGLIVPLIAVHLFVFYFGIMADVTPPVGLASFAAAAVSKGDPIKTGLVAFFYSLRTAALPFLFIFNTDLLLIDVDFWHGVLIFIVATIAMLIFAAGTQGFFLVRSRWYESVLLLVVAFSLFRPGFWMDMVHDPYQDIPPAQLAQALDGVEDGSSLRLRIRGEDAVGDPREFSLLLPVPDGATGEERLQKLGLNLYEEDGKVLVDSVAFGSMAADAGLEFDQQILKVRAPTDRWVKELMWIPAFVLFGLIVLLQRRRQVPQAA